LLGKIRLPGFRLHHPEIEPRLFPSITLMGALPSLLRAWHEQHIDEDLVIPNKELPCARADLAMRNHPRPTTSQTLTSLAKFYNKLRRRQWNDLPKKRKTPSCMAPARRDKILLRRRLALLQHHEPFEGVITNINALCAETESEWSRVGAWRNISPNLHVPGEAATAIASTGVAVRQDRRQAYRRNLGVVRCAAPGNGRDVPKALTAHRTRMHSPFC